MALWWGFGAGYRDRERERDMYSALPESSTKHGGPYGPGSFARTLNLKEEEICTDAHIDGHTDGQAHIQMHICTQIPSSQQSSPRPRGIRAKGLMTVRHLGRLSATF